MKKTKRQRIVSRRYKRSSKAWKLINNWMNKHLSSARHNKIPGVSTWVWRINGYTIMYDRLIRANLIEIHKGNRELVGLGNQGGLLGMCSDSICCISISSLKKLLESFNESPNKKTCRQ